MVLRLKINIVKKLEKLFSWVAGNLTWDIIKSLISLVISWWLSANVREEIGGWVIRNQWVFLIFTTFTLYGVLTLLTTIGKVFLRKNIYEDYFDLEHYIPEPSDSERRGRLLLGRQNPQSLEALVSAKVFELYGASIRIKRVAFENPGYDNPAPLPPVRPLKWLDYQSENGKINIAPDTGERLQVAILSTIGIGGFQWSLFDGPSGRTISLWGRFTITLQLSGRIRNEEKEESIVPILFKMAFEYRGNGFTDVIVDKVSRKKGK